MKYKLFGVFCFMVSIHSLLGRSEMTEAKFACNMVEAAVWSDFLSNGKNLPSAWDQIPSVLDMRNNISTQNFDNLRQINSFAIVTNAPIIQAEPGILKNHSDRRLFSISRTREFYDKKSKLSNEISTMGRYAIFVSPDNSGITSSWITEPEAQIILKQLKDFDPAKQPIAFENLSQVARDEKAAQDQAHQEITEHLKKKGRLGQNGELLPSTYKSIGYGPWIAGGAMLSAVLLWRMFRKPATRSVKNNRHRR